jgi:hypothetical protein
MIATPAATFGPRAWYRGLNDEGHLAVASQDAAGRARSDSAPATIKAIGDAVTAASAEPLEDDATIVVLVPTSGTTSTDRADDQAKSASSTE